MSAYTFFASEYPLTAVPNPYLESFSINDMLAHNMEIPDFLKESDLFKTIDRNMTIMVRYKTEDGADEINIYLTEPGPQTAYYTSKKYIACLEWKYSERRAEELLDYIREHLQEADELELWSIYLEDHDTPELLKYTLDDLTIEPLRLMFQDSRYTRPRCLRVRKENETV
ncbi:hypothetical protein [Anaerolentibacter hominis]|uniref:hypothetical protein n=1 Tax=Anaerolentibacter hominis TaxID=3079009 RepID=UPI0031B81C06